MSEPRRNHEALRQLFELAERLRDEVSLPAQHVRLAHYRLIVARLQPESPPAPEPVASLEPAAVEPAAATLPADRASPALEAQVSAARAQAEAALRAVPVSSSTHQRVTRLATAFVGLLALVVLAGPRIARWMEPVDLAKGKPWQASSTLFTCYPDRIDCGGAQTTIFFHTQEENEPWVLFDLEAPTTFTSVTVVNRRDAARERAVPLVIEVSNDDASWKEVARRTDEFSTWKASFESTTARYVRLRVLKRTYLHLDAVRVHP